MRWFGLVLLLTLGSAASASAPTTDRNPAFSCGGETTEPVVRQYFADLELALARPRPADRFNRFVNPRFGIRDKRGKTRYFAAADFRSITPGLIPLADWHEISKRGIANLQNAGWRGCFLDLGKASFEASRKFGFRLIFLDRSRAWSKTVRAR